MKHTDWRNNTEETDNHYIAFIVGETAERRALGQREYGATFQGWPLEHAWEEVLDLQFYLAVEMRRHSDEMYRTREVVRMESLD